MEKRKNMEMNINFIILFLFCVNEVTSKKLKSNNTMKWLDAQSFCREKGMISRYGKFSLDEQESGRYWTRRYTKRSNWIHFLGCYDQDIVLQYAKFNQTIQDLTLSKCQDFCLNDLEIFGIQRNTCICLSKHEFHTQRLHLGKCWFGKGLQGGNNSFSVYRTTDFNAIQSNNNDATDQKRLCVQMFCDKNKHGKFTKSSCESYGNAICTTTVLEGNYTWEQAMLNCVNQSTEMSVEYLTADVDLNSKSSNICSKYSSLNDRPLWLGILSITSESEYTDITDLKKVIQCHSCEKVCKFEDCSESRQAFCETLPERVTIGNYDPTSQNYPGTLTSDPKAYSNTLKSTTAYEKSSHTPTDTLYSSVSQNEKSSPTPPNASYSSVSHEKSSPTLTDASYSSVSNEKSPTPTDAFYSSVSHTDTYSSNHTSSHTQGSDAIYTAAIYSVPVAVVIIILVVCLLYCRRKHQRKQNLKLESNAGSKPSSSHLVSKTDFYELADNSKLENLHSETKTQNTENVQETSEAERKMCAKANSTNVSELTNDIYNHLREADDVIDQRENIYDRSTMLHDKENPLYDVSSNKAYQKVSSDPTYDHAAPVDKLKN